jgi:lantibiotic modifying enzyme
MNQTAQITEHILTHLLSHKHHSISLYYDEGLIVLYAYAYQITKQDIYLDKILELVEHSIDLMNNTQLLTTSIAGGVAGTAWIFTHLMNEGLIEHDDELLNNFDELIVSSLENDSNEKNYDFFHGLIGKCFYFLERQILKPDDKQLEKLFDYLESMVTKIDNLNLWQITNEKELICNLGLSHGIPSILVLYCKFYNKGIKKAYIELRLKEIAAWLLSKIDKTRLSYFSYDTSIESEASRLAWCYGDLGIAITFLHLYKTLEDNFYKNIAIDIALHASKRSLDNSGVMFNDISNYAEATFCHGSCGIAYIFDKFYKETNIESFKISATYWYDLTNEAFQKNNGCGFFSCKNPLNQIWKLDNSLLEGASGVGLALLSQLHGHEYAATWDKFFLLHFE